MHVGEAVEKAEQLQHLQCRGARISGWASQGRGSLVILERLPCVPGSHPSSLCRGFV